MSSVRENPDILEKKSEELRKNGDKIDDLLKKFECISNLILASKLNYKDKQIFAQLKENMYYRRDELWEESGELLKNFYKLKRKIAKNL